MTEDKTTLVTFSGKQEHYALWKINFLARAKSKGYEDYLLGKKSLPVGTTDSNGVVTFSDDERKEVSKVQKGWADLINCLDTTKPNGANLAMEIAPIGEGAEVPNIKKAWERIKAKFEASNSTQRRLKLAEFNETTLEPGESPEMLFIKLKTIRRELSEMGETLTDTQFIDRIFGKFPHDAYDSTLEAIKTMVNPTIEQIEERLNERYNNIKSGMKKQKQRNDEEIAMAATEELNSNVLMMRDSSNVGHGLGTSGAAALTVPRASGPVTLNVFEGQVGNIGGQQGQYYLPVRQDTGMVEMPTVFNPVNAAG